MTHRTALCGTTAFLLATAGMAQAEITGAEVWANWQSAAAGLGQTLTPGNETQSGDTLTITDLQISMPMPDGSVEGSIAMVEFVDRSDGTVGITMSPSYDMTVIVDPEIGEAVNVALQVTQEGLTMVASGGDGEVTYDFLAPSMSFGVTNLEVDGEMIELLAEGVLTDMDGKYVVTEGDTPVVTTQFTAANMTINVDMNEPDGGDGSFAMALAYSDLVAESAGSLMMMANPEELSMLLDKGLGTATSFTHGPATFEVNFQDAPDMFALSGSAATGEFDVALDGEQLAYAFGNTGLDISMSGSEIPLPEVAFALGELGFALLMPSSPSETPEDFGLGITLADLAVSDMIWSMIDAGGQLPHDPATLIFDVTGQANWLFDIFNPESMMEVEADMPAELHALDLNSLVVAVAGAELTGSGAFTFDNTDLETFDGMPAPTGSIDLKLVGGNGLLDSLVAMGLLPEDQAMGARMMMGLFARPGDGEDTLVSTIEVDGATGAVSANGQRLQ
ncbi:MAG: DUF2125 domain-containing protein [Rhodobacter sp.]|nr:DUF2125 domain-containing protein [Rhodobacter sp.]